MQSDSHEHNIRSKTTKWCVGGNHSLSWHSVECPVISEKKLFNTNTEHESCEIDPSLSLTKSIVFEKLFLIPSIVDLPD